MNKNLLVISSFPEKGLVHGEKTVGVASYTKNMLLGILNAAKKEEKGLSITVLAEKLLGEEKSYIDQAIHIDRIWERNNLWAQMILLRKAIVFPTKEVFIAFELAMFGGSFSLFFFLILLLLLRLSGKKTTVILHHVILDLNAVSEHINIREGSLMSKFGTIALRIFYKLLSFTACKIVVFDKILKDSFVGNQNKVVVISHGVESASIKTTKEKAREKLGVKNDEFLLVSFGYLAWYKGTDWLIDAVDALPERINGKKIRLIVSGGANTNRLTMSFYRKYIEKLQNIAYKSKGKIIITGYVPENKISLYYHAADCLIYPYRTVFSASGPLSLAFTYNKPFLLADSMAAIAKTNDFRQALGKEKIDIEDIIFPLNIATFKNVINKVIKDKIFINKLVNISSTLAKLRSFEEIGKAYLSLIR